MGSLPVVYSVSHAESANIAVKARFTAFDESSRPVNVYVFDALSYVVDGEHISPRNDLTDDGRYARIAEYISSDTVTPAVDTPFVVYHLDAMSVTDREIVNEMDNPDGVARLLSLATLHELTHWGVDDDTQPHTREHWDQWNTVLYDILQVDNGA